MFESLYLYELQIYWWHIISLLAACLVFLMFVQGGQSFIFNFRKNSKEKTFIIQELGHKWELGFTTLVTFGGAFFASFPLFYSTSFGGAYWVWMLILFCFVIQAVAYEFRSKAGNLFGESVYDGFLFINGTLGVFLIGVAVATFFTGSAFSVNFDNLLNFTAKQSMTISSWQHPAHGLEALLNPLNLCLGLVLVFLSRSLALLFFIHRSDEVDFRLNCQKKLKRNASLFLITFLIFISCIFLKKGFAIDFFTHEVYMQDYKYFRNFIEMPLLGILFLIGTLSVLIGIGLGWAPFLFKKGIWFAGGGSILVIYTLFLNLGLNHTSFYPSTFDLQSSLSIENSSSSLFTLKVMSYASLFIPVVIFYISYVWRKMTKKKKEEVY